VKKGDTVTLYMPMVVELAVACLACARIGAIHSVVFGGFSPEVGCCNMKPVFKTRLVPVLESNI
jgi:hypothetical protein